LRNSGRISPAAVIPLGAALDRRQPVLSKYGKSAKNRHHFGIHRGFSGGMWSLATPPDDEIMSGA